MIKIKKLTKTATIPTRGTAESAGMDLYADINEPIKINPKEIAKIHTGIAVQLEKGTVGLIFARSGLGTKHGIVPANCVGVIDSDYRGEIMVSLINNYSEKYVINPYDRIAQLVIVNALFPDVEICNDLDDSERGIGGFGSTGK